MRPPDAFEEFARMASLPDDALSAFDLAEAALLIAQAEYPQLDRAACLLQLGDLADEIRPRLRAESGYGTVNALSHFLFEEQRFRGNADDYYDARNSYLNDVLDRRLGIPITLSLLYIEVARRAGVRAHGVGLPGHFIVQVEANDEHVLIDPFNGGTILTHEDCSRLMEMSAGYSAPLDDDVLRPVTPREFLLRMLNNLRTIHLNAQDYPRALAIVERIALLLPDDPRELRLRDALRNVASQ